MNAHTFPLPSPAKGEVSREWHAVTYNFMGRREVVLDSKGEPLMFAYPGLARAAASGHPGGSGLWMGRSPVAPTLEQIRAVANPEPLPRIESFDIDAIDSHKTGRMDDLVGGRVGTDAWRI